MVKSNIKKYKSHRFSSDIIPHLVWLYYRFNLSQRDIESLLKDGSRLIGTVIAAKDGLVTLKTNFAGTLSMSMDQIVPVNTRNPVVVILADETVFTLSGELGFSYVTEKYNIAKEKQYGASNCNFRITSNYLGGKSALYFY